MTKKKDDKEPIQAYQSITAYGKLLLVSRRMKGTNYWVLEVTHTCNKLVNSSNLMYASKPQYTQVNHIWYIKL